MIVQEKIGDEGSSTNRYTVLEKGWCEYVMVEEVKTKAEHANFHTLWFSGR